MGFLWRLAKRKIDQTVLLPVVYRNIRDELRFRLHEQVKTPIGFWFAGDRSMEAGTFEPEETKIVNEFLSKTDVFVDVGANAGFHSCLARSRDKHVLAVEPCPGNLRSLFRNLEANSWLDVEVWPIALAQTPGCLTLWGCNTGASLLEGWAGISKSWKQTVAVNTLDNILGGRFQGSRLFIKVDVEGAEFGCLAGAVATLARRPRPVWLVEICLCEHHPKTNPNFLRTFEIFWRNSYQAFTVGKRHPVSEDDVRKWIDAGTSDSESHNYLFI